MTTLAEILYESVDGSFAIDARQRIIYWDRGCEELLGYSEQWALGRPCCSVIRASHPTSGRMVCQENCEVANLTTMQNAPKSLLVKIKDSTGNFVNLSVNVILVPSSCKKNWHVMHLLHRTLCTDVLVAMDKHNRGDKINTHKCQKTAVPAQANQSLLTPRESEVLALLAEGISSSIISERLHISHTTVRNHIQHLQKKLGVHSKTQAVAYAYRHHFI